MLSFENFLIKSDISLNKLFVDKFWNIKKKSILIDDQIIRWLTSNPNAEISSSRNSIKKKNH